jgi:hypothetical protein
VKSIGQTGLQFVVPPQQLLMVPQYVSPLPDSHWTAGQKTAEPQQMWSSQVRPGGQSFPQSSVPPHPSPMLPQ